MKSKENRRTKNIKNRKLIDAKMSFAEVMQKYPQTSEVFFKHGMACFGCPAAMQETIEDGIKAHGEDVREIIDKLNKAVRKKIEK